MDFKLLRPLALAPLALVSVLAAPAVAQQSPSPTPSAAPTPGPSEPSDCPPYTTAVSPRVVDTGATATVTITTDRSTSLRITRSQPGPSAVVRQVERTQAGEPNTFAFRLGESHRFYIGVGSRCGRPDEILDIAVRPRLTIAAVRNSVRDYSFTGRVTPGRGQAVDLYRVSTDGSRILTARSTAGPDGTYRIDRRFGGSGRFGFEARVSNSATNLAGASPVRPTVIH